jgi:hypothetical protein
MAQGLLAFFRARAVNGPSPGRHPHLVSAILFPADMPKP